MQWEGGSPNERPVAVHTLSLRADLMGVSPGAGWVVLLDLLSTRPSHRVAVLSPGVGLYT